MPDSSIFRQKVVVHNTAYDYQRRQFRLVSLDTEEGLWLIEQRTKAFEDPEAMVIRQESASELLHTLTKGVSAKYARVLFLYYYEDEPIKRIAKRLGLPEGTIKSHLSRGREHLQRELVHMRVLSEVEGRFLGCRMHSISYGFLGDLAYLGLLHFPKRDDMLARTRGMREGCRRAKGAEGA